MTKMDPEELEKHSYTTIWFPGVYSGRQGVYAQTVQFIQFDDLVELVQKRADEDGNWAIDNDFVGPNEDKMRRMMEFVSDPTNIRQCLEHLTKNNEESIRTVDWVCRDLAKASKMMVR